MPDSPPPDLRLDPGAVPGLRAAVDRALEGLDASLRDLDTGARLPRPWLGDPVSAQAAQTYAQHSTDGPDAALGALRAYRAELVRVRDALSGTHTAYTGTEDVVASSFGPGR